MDVSRRALVRQVEPGRQPVRPVGVPPAARAATPRTAGQPTIQLARRVPQAAATPSLSGVAVTARPLRSVSELMASSSTVRIDLGGPPTEIAIVPPKTIYETPPSVRLVTYAPVRGLQPGSERCFLFVQEPPQSIGMVTMPWAGKHKGDTFSFPPPEEKSWWDELGDAIGSVIEAMAWAGWRIRTLRSRSATPATSTSSGATEALTEGRAGPLTLA